MAFGSFFKKIFSRRSSEKPQEQDTASPVTESPAQGEPQTTSVPAAPPDAAELEKGFRVIIYKGDWNYKEVFYSIFSEFRYDLVGCGSEPFYFGNSALETNRMMIFILQV